MGDKKIMQFTLPVRYPTARYRSSETFGWRLGDAVIALDLLVFISSVNLPYEPRANPRNPTLLHHRQPAFERLLSPVKHYLIGKRRRNHGIEGKTRQVVPYRDLPCH
jgi:hypothetical protein